MTAARTGARLALRLALVAVAVLAGAYAVVLAAEAEKEVWALCGNVAPGQDRDRVVAMFETGNLLSLDRGADRLIAASRHDRRANRCVVSFADGVVVDRAYTEAWGVGMVGALVALPLLAVLVGFQLLLALGFPLGRWAWGGRHSRLPGLLRSASAAAAVILTAGGAAVAGRAGLVNGVPPAPAEAAAWVLTLVFLLSTLGNAASPSARERRLWTPVALLLALGCLAVALAP